MYLTKLEGEHIESRSKRYQSLSLKLDSILAPLNIALTSGMEPQLAIFKSH